MRHVQDLNFKVYDLNKSGFSHYSSLGILYKIEGHWLLTKLFQRKSNSNKRIFDSKIGTEIIFSSKITQFFKKKNGLFLSETA